MKAAGADRYLLRHETADREHYQKLHPPELSFDNRMGCLKDLKDLGFQTGCGFMVGSPYQTPETLGKDLKFVEEFQPAMCGIGPFIPHRDTPFREFPAGSVELTLYLLSPAAAHQAGPAAARHHRPGDLTGGRPGAGDAGEGPTWSCPTCPLPTRRRSTPCTTASSFRERNPPGIWRT